ncbi:NXPE family member 2-like [Acipenser ruthenus]|uniref:NXPE family member 2-like n=1 Tax=Acipenser ruthenus TaxID=7906 RepID=UPI0027410794|nr:NXPE family member 2-like [Acipenser ruthenus]
MNDYHGKPKAYGGDFILARIHSPELKAGAAGVSEDFNNGTYRVNFTLFWPGSVKVSVRLIHSSEVVSAFWRTKESGSDKIMFTGIFLNKTKQEKSRCDVHLIMNETVCDLKKDSFYCVKPKTLPLQSTRDDEGIKKGYLQKEETQFALCKCFLFLDRVPQAAGKCQLGMSSPSPSGFFHSDRWNSSYCRMSHFQNVNDINQCLQGKQVYMWGDSTVRQWFEYLKDHHLAYTSTTESAARRLAIDKTRHITIYWKMHGFPCIASRPCAVDNGLDVAQELDRFAGGENTVVVISVGQHLRPFPLKFYVTRMMDIKQAVTRLLQRSPLTRVFVKLENTRELDFQLVRFSDWYGHLQSLALKEVFRGVKVGFIDAWDMTVAANSFAVHPNRNIVHYEIALFLSYLCGPNS